MKSSILENIALLLFLSVISSCITYKTVYIETLQPAVVPVPKNIENILVIYNPDKVRTVFLTNNGDKKVEKKLGLQNQIIDSLYSSILHYNREIGKYQKFQKKIYKGKITAKKMEELCKFSNAHGVLIIENLDFFVFQSENNNYYLNGKPMFYTYYLIKSGIKFYSTKRGRFLDDVIFSDNWGETHGGAKSNYIAEAQYVGGYIAETYFSRISPNWNKQSRTMVLTENDGFHKAWKHVEENQWDSALNIWKTYADCESKRVSNYARLNMAVCYEVLDNVEIADSLMDEVLLRSNKFIFKRYSYQLFKRKRAKKALAIQL